MEHFFVNQWGGGGVPSKQTLTKPYTRHTGLKQIFIFSLTE
jgi:hypothetical protein